MSIDEGPRFTLYERLVEVLGPDHAVTLMNHLPPWGWGDVATRGQFDSFEQRIEARFDRVDERFDRVDERFEKVDERFDRVDERFDRVDERFEKVDERFDKIGARFDGVETRMGHHLSVHIAATIGAVLATATAVIAGAQLL